MRSSGEGDKGERPNSMKGGWVSDSVSAAEAPMLDGETLPNLVREGRVKRPRRPTGTQKKRLNKRSATHGRVAIFKEHGLKHHRGHLIGQHPANSGVDVLIKNPTNQIGQIVP